MNRTFASPLSALLVLVLISSVSLAWPEASPCSGENASQSVSVTYAQSAPLGSAAWAALTSAEWCVGTSVYALGECHYAARDCASGTCSAVSSIVGGAKNVVSA
ncbi:hypothetical protein KJ815_10815, partial [bacterium]|nr:hypothetical protein [bacterium]